MKTDEENVLCRHMTYDYLINLINPLTVIAQYVAVLHPISKDHRIGND